MLIHSTNLLLFFFNDTATTEIYTLSLHDALPISPGLAAPALAMAAPPRPPKQDDERLAAIKSLLWGSRDRKSTRLNSSHGYISYAVFCLKKKKNNVAIMILLLLVDRRYLDSVAE